MGERTNQLIRDMDQWEKNASDREIQYQQLRVAVETRELVATIRNIALFFFVVWCISVVVFVVAAETVN